MKTLLYVITTLCLLAWLMCLFTDEEVATTNFLIGLPIIGFLCTLIRRSEI
jgi:hypothetical protein